MRSLPSSTQSHVKLPLGPCVLSSWKRSIHYWTCPNLTYPMPPDTPILSASKSIWRLNKSTHFLPALILKPKRTPERLASTLWPSPATSISTRIIIRLRFVNWRRIHGTIWSSRLVVTVAHLQMFVLCLQAISTSLIAGTYRTSPMALSVLWQRKWLRSLRKPLLITKSRRVNRTLSYS